MSPNKDTVENYIDGFNKGNHAKILSCLTDDVEWRMPGVFHVFGKEAFDQKIESEDLTGLPEVKLTHMMEDKDTIVAEGTIRCAKKAGGFMNAAFSDVFVMENARIRRLTTYISEIEEQA